MISAKTLLLEFHKQYRNFSFWFIIALYLVAILLAFSNFSKLTATISGSFNNVPELDFSLKALLQFPDVWHNVTYISSFFRIIPALLIIISISDEFRNRTIRLNLMNGLSRTEFVVSKFSFATLLAVFCTIVTGTGILFIGFSNMPEASGQSIYFKSEFLFAFFISCLAYFYYAALIAFLLKQSGTAVILLLLYGWLLEPIVSWMIPSEYRIYLPMKSVDKLIQFPFTKYLDMPTQETIVLSQIIIVLAYVLISAFLSNFLLKKTKL